MGRGKIVSFGPACNEEGGEMPAGKPERGTYSAFLAGKAV
jgi:hypothetical protein